MPKKCKIAAYMLIAAACALIFAGKMNTGASLAAAVGVVDAGGSLNVRTGPGTSYDLLKSGGTSITLSSGQKVSIIAKNGKWYHIKFVQNGKNLKGYVNGSYIKVQTGKVRTSISAKSAVEGLKLKKEAAGAEYVKNGADAVLVGKGASVNIKDESIVKNKKWYYVIYKSSGEKFKGYASAQSLEIEYGDGVPGIWDGEAKTPLYEKPGEKEAVKLSGSAVNIGKNKQFTVLGEESASDERYFHIRVSADGESADGYVPAMNARFQIVKSETSPQSGEGGEKGDGDSSQSPQPQSSPSPSESPSAAPEAMTDEEFKKELYGQEFPESYIKPLMVLHEKYPYWKFKAFHTGLKWNSVIKKESAVGLNLVGSGKARAWKSTADGAYDWTSDKYIPYDGGTWVTASVEAVEYYMDPRNFLDERGIFQFESLEYQSDVQTQSGVEKILVNTPIHNAKFSYPNSSGNKVSIKYSKAFIKAAALSKVSPYHLASRVKQEVVVGPNLMSSSVSGNVSGYKGIFNFYNIGAYNSTKAGGAVANALKWASTGSTYKRPWNNRYKAIVGGAQYIGKNYINVGQNTLYLEKFNVTSKKRYEHQYMANIEAPNSEATKTVSAYGDIDEDMPMTFSIPVYEEMPAEPCEVPSGDESPNNYLKTLYVKNHPFTSPFKLGDDGSRTYKLSVDAGVKSIKICATKVSSHAVLTGAGSKKLSDGVNSFTVKVTSESGSVRRYKIEATRK